MPFVDNQNRLNRRDVSDSNAMTVVGVVALIVVVIAGGTLYAITTRSNHTAVINPKTEISASTETPLPRPKPSTTGAGSQ
jgi:hypothetical protein